MSRSLWLLAITPAFILASSCSEDTIGSHGTPSGDTGASQSSGTGSGDAAPPSLLSTSELGTSDTVAIRATTDSGILLAEVDSVRKVAADGAVLQSWSPPPDTHSFRVARGEHGVSFASAVYFPSDGRAGDEQPPAQVLRFAANGAPLPSLLLQNAGFDEWILDMETTPSNTLWVAGGSPDLMHGWLYSFPDGMFDGATIDTPYQVKDIAPGEGSIFTSGVSPGSLYHLERISAEGQTVWSDTDFYKEPAISAWEEDVFCAFRQEETLVLRHYSGAGARTWETEFDDYGGFVDPSRLIATESALYVAGRYRHASGETDGFLEGFSPETGERMWSIRHGLTPSSAKFIDMDVQPDGNIVVLASTPVSSIYHHKILVYGWP